MLTQHKLASIVASLTSIAKIDLSPNVMDQHAYVYSTYANVIKNIARRAFNGKFLAYLFPRMFLENNKNVVYSNGESEVYK
jgi:hypothetical protein